VAANSEIRDGPGKGGVGDGMPQGAEPRRGEKPAAGRRNLLKKNSSAIFQRGVTVALQWRVLTLPPTAKE